MSSSSRYYAEFYLHHFNTYHLALQNGPFGVAKRSISQRKTACFRTRNGMYWKLLDNQCVINVLGFNRYYDFIFCVVMSVLINVKTIDSLLIVPPFYVRGILCGRPD